MVSIITLGCRVSQYESDAIKEELLKKGIQAQTGFCLADYYVLNTCAVTNEAERKSRNYLTKITNKNKNARIIVCGCASEHISENFLKNENVIFVCGNKGKNKISNFIENYIKNNEKTQINSEKLQKLEGFSKNYCEKLDEQYESFSCVTTSRAKAYLKIQDGCNNFCSYCLIPYIRGRSRSRALDEIINEAESLSKDNHEIVLTGINMSDYKINNELALGKVLDSLKHIPSRIRIGSLEVNIITKEFLDILRHMPNFCPQFHLSMQSGCNKILKLMNRHYTKDEYLEKISLIREYFKDAAITTDVIVGFPTETEQDFLETIDTIKKAKFFKMHIFPYSMREGTKAVKLEQVLNSVKKERVKVLEKLDKELHDEYLQKMIDKEQVVLTEQQEDDFVVGHTETSIKVYLPKNTNLHKLVKVKIGKVFNDGVIGITE